MEKQKRLYGTFQMNGNLPVHSWYPYLAGYSAHFVKEELNRYKIYNGHKVLDPFLGVGTTSVVAKSNDINSIGIEVNPFASFVAKTKLYWEYDLQKLQTTVNNTISKIKSDRTHKFEHNYPDIIKQAFSPKILSKLIKIKNHINNIRDEHIRDLLKLALVRILKQVSNCKNFAPYFQLKSEKLENAPVLELFCETAENMINDLKQCPKVKANFKVHTGDSRDLSFIDDESICCAITSPPYLNNWDYSYITRVELYFLGFYNSIDEISKDLKSKLIKSSGFVLGNVDRKIIPELGNDNLDNEIVRLKNRLFEASKSRVLRYDLMVTAYFNDMHKVLSEVYRVLKHNGGISVVVGDSCLYGVHIPTDKIIAKIGKSIGYKPEIELLRERRATQHSHKLIESSQRQKKRI